MAFQKGHNGLINGKRLRTKESYKEQGVYLSALYIGKNTFNKNLGEGMKGKKHSEETIKKMSISAIKRKQKGVPKFYSRKDNNKTDESKIWRKRNEYKNWRIKVFERDNYKCQKCFIRGAGLHPHHIKSFAIYKELRFDINNGITLCVKCHLEIHRVRNKNGIYMVK